MQTRPYRPKRSVRRAEADAQRPPQPVHHSHLTRRDRERRLQRLAIAGAAIIVLVVLLIPAYGYWREVLHLGDEPLVTVDGQTITTQDYARYLGARQTILTRQLTQAQAAVPTPAATTTAATPVANGTPVAATPTARQSAAQQTVETLSQEESGLSTTALTDLVEAHLILDEAKKRNLTVSQSELDNGLRWLMSPPPPGLQPQQFGLAAAPASPSGSNLVSIDQAKQALNQIVGQAHYLTTAQMEDLIVKPSVLKAKLVSDLSKDIPPTADEVHARHILVASEAEAKSIRQQLADGADFATLAKQHSTDPGTKNKGGDLGWFGRGVMDPAFEQAAFSLKVGEISQPVKTQFGYHIIQVLAKDAHHELDPAELDQARGQAYQSWLSKQESDSKVVSYELSSEKMTWVQRYISKGN